MRRFVRTLAAIAAATSTAAPAAAQPQPNPPASVPVWRLDWTENLCQLATESPGTIGVALRITPGASGAGLSLIGPRSLPSTKPRAATTVTLAPSGASFSGTIFEMEAPGKRVLQIGRLPHAFVEAFGKAEAVTATVGGKSVTGSVKGASEAMAAMRQCVDEALQRWGIDPKAFAALKQPARALQEEGILRADDYPAEALAKNESGIVVARLSVDAAGRITGCAPVVSSNSQSLDAVTCRIWSERVKYQPAIGADGIPASSFVIIKTQWCMDVRSCERLKEKRIG